AMFFLGAVVFGCTKEKDIVDVSMEGSAPGIGFGGTLSDGISISEVSTVGVITDSLKVFLSGVTGNASVQVAEDPSAVDDYNNINGTSYEQAPSGTYNLPSSIDVTGSSGSAAASFDVTKMSAGGSTFAVGVKITSVSGSTSNIISGQQRVVFTITIKNQYEADYTVKGYFVHPSSPRDIADDKHLYTISSVRCEAPHSDLYGSNYYFMFDVSSDNKLINYAPLGATTNGGFMTKDNPVGLSTYPGSPYVSSTYNNTYDPSGKIFWMHYGYDPSGTTDENKYTRQVYEKWTRDN
ncbi:MAG TPA: DUF1735 domain-containing protein, partial [Chitinophagaceae bacterium]|nr:DUF1735 domain-containing protein [Chitinophagaceae bacterium]